MVAPTAQELDLVKELRLRIPDVQLDEYESLDECILTWLRARNYNVDKSEQMLRRAIKYREERGHDTILAWQPPPYYSYYFPLQHPGVDKEGNPVVIVPVCWWEPYVRKELAAGMKDTLHRYIEKQAFVVLAELKSLYKQQKRVLTQFIIIFDTRGFTIGHCTSIGVQEILLVAFRKLESTFPEALKICFVINAPKIFSILHQFVKPFVSPKTFAKAVVFDSNAEKWQKELLKNIDEDQLPKYYGGTQADILQEGGYHFDQEENLIEVIIEPGGAFALEYEIRAPGTVLSWIFKTENFNIGFHVSSSLSEKVLVPYQRLNSHETVQHGSITCHTEGKYVLNFDNKFSRFRAKTLYYFVATDEPKSDSGLHSKQLRSQPTSNGSLKQSPLTS